MEALKGKLAEHAGDTLKARVEAALFEAKERQARGDLHGARELALAILAIGEEHIEARQLLAAVELASLPRAPRTGAAHAEAEHEVAPPAEPSAPPARPRPEVVVLGASPSGERRSLEESLPVPRPLPELKEPLPWAPREAPQARPRRRLSMTAVSAGAGALLLVVALALVLRARMGRQETAPAETAPSPIAAQEPAPAALPESTTPAPESVPTAPAATAASAPPFDPHFPARIDALLAKGDYGEAARSVDDALRSQPSERRLRDLQRRVRTEARRATDQALAGLREARAAAESVRAPEVAAWVFQRASDFEDAADRLGRKEEWTEALAKAHQAAVAYGEAQDLARLEQARTAYREARARALEAGADRLAGERLSEGHSRAARAQGAAERRDVRAAIEEFQSAATAMAEARRAADAAAAAQRAAAAPPSAPARTPESDREEILSVIRRYTAAMEAKDLRALQALWPNMGADQEAKIRSSFQFAQSLRVQLEVTSIHLEERRAVVLCRRRDIITTTDGQTLNNERPGTITLARSDKWAIATIQ
jgi:hypothetical protein